MPPPVIQRVLNQLDKIGIPSLFKPSEPHRYEPLSMAASNSTNRISEVSAAKADIGFSEDVEASRASSKSGENTHIQRVELTEEDVCPSLPDCGSATCGGRLG